MAICNKFIVFVAICIFGWGKVCECQVFFGGECLDLERIKDFNLTKFMGEWYEFQKYPSDLEKTTKCNMLNFELKETGDVTVLKSRYDSLSESFDEMVGTIPNAESGRMLVQFKDAASSTRSRFWVLDTDYTHYSVLYACTSITHHYHTKMVWIMTRAKHPKAEDVVKAFHALAVNRLPTSYLSSTDQYGCDRGSAIVDKVMEFS